MLTALAEHHPKLLPLVRRLLRPVTQPGDACDARVRALQSTAACAQLGLVYEYGPDEGKACATARELKIPPSSEIVVPGATMPPQKMPTDAMHLPPTCVLPFEQLPVEVTCDCLAAEFSVPCVATKGGMTAALLSSEYAMACNADPDMGGFQDEIRPSVRRHSPTCFVWRACTLASSNYCCRACAPEPPPALSVLSGGRAGLGLHLPPSAPCVLRGRRSQAVARGIRDICWV